MLMERLRPFWFPAIVLIFSIVYFIDSFSYSTKASIFPLTLIVIIFLTLIPSVYSDIKKLRENSAVSEEIEAERENEDKEFKNAPIVLGLAVILYIPILPIVGFIVTTLLFLSVTMLFYKLPVKFVIWFAPLSTIILYLLFKVLVGVQFPSGLVDHLF